MYINLSLIFFVLVCSDVFCVFVGLLSCIF